MSPLNQTLIEEFKNIVFEKAELECQDKSTLIEILPVLVNQDPKSDVRDQFHELWEWTVSFKYKVIAWHVEWKLKEAELKRYEIDYWGMSRPVAVFVISDLLEIHSMDEKWDYLMEKSSKIRRLRIETLKKDFKPVYFG